MGLLHRRHGDTDSSDPDRRRRQRQRDRGQHRHRRQQYGEQFGLGVRRLHDRHRPFSSTAFVPRGANADTALGDNISHEAGHTFGMQHIYNTTGRPHRHAGQFGGDGLRLVLDAIRVLYPLPAALGLCPGHARHAARPGGHRLRPPRQQQPAGSERLVPGLRHGHGDVRHHHHYRQRGQYGAGERRHLQRREPHDAPERSRRQCHLYGPRRPVAHHLHRQRQRVHLHREHVQRDPHRRGRRHRLGRRRRQHRRQRFDSRHGRGQSPGDPRPRGDQRLL